MATDITREQRAAYFEHPLIKEGTLEKRLYQETILASCAKKNSLVVLPTGLGKTPVAILLAAIRLQRYPDSKILMMAPTKPLVEQHRKSFMKVMELDEKDFVVLTGKISSEKRAELWKNGKIFFATPQIVENDIIRGVLSLQDFSLVVFDEAHRTVGDYAYVYIARKYMEEAKHPLILGLTASPGGTAEKIGTICGNLFVENVEIRSEEDWDVKPYVVKKEIKWVMVELPGEMKRIIQYLESALKKRLDALKDIGLVRTSSSKIGKGAILQLQEELNKAMSRGEKKEYMYGAMVTIASALKIIHALELLQTQGVEQAYEFFRKLGEERKTKSVISVLGDEDVRKAIAALRWLMEQGVRHPKLDRLIHVLRDELHHDQKAIVFTQYVKSAEIIVDEISKKTELKPVMFVGQRKGLTQKKQIETIEKFRKGEYNILVASSVAEEGLDIPKVDLVVFYEPVPSEIRAIQRRGRTGRFREGKIVVLIGKGTIDEAYYWSARHKERRMRYLLKKMRDELKETRVVIRTAGSVEKMGYADEKKREGQRSLDHFIKNENNDDKKESAAGTGAMVPIIYADVRERNVVKILQEMGADVRIKQLEVGDFQISGDVGVERKSANDFVQSIIDGRLFSQLRNLCENFDRPVLIIEGDNLLGKRNVHPNAIRGAIASAVIDFRVPILFTKDERETALLLISIARREQEEKKKDIKIRTDRPPRDPALLQEYIVAGLPGINSKLARRLLEHFGTVRNVFRAGEIELQRVEGIGKMKARSISQILDRKYERNEESDKK